MRISDHRVQTFTKKFSKKSVDMASGMGYNKNIEREDKIMVNTKKMNYEDKFTRAYSCPNRKHRYTKMIKKLNNKRVRQQLKREVD